MLRFIESTCNKKSDNTYLAYTMFSVVGKRKLLKFPNTFEIASAQPWYQQL